MAAQGFYGARTSGRPVGKAWGNDCKWNFKAQKGEMPRRCAHVAYKTTPRVVDESNAKRSWRQRAGAMGGGTDVLSSLIFCPPGKPTPFSAVSGVALVRCQR